MAKEKPITENDAGAALMAWYDEAIRQFPEGLVTQAQAAHMLGVSRMAVGRLLGRGYLRAVWFPHPPAVPGLAITRDDPTWLKIWGWLGKRADVDGVSFPEACYVSFADVKRAWVSADVQKRCAVNWGERFRVAYSERRLDELNHRKRKEHRNIAEAERKKDGKQ